MTEGFIQAPVRAEPAAQTGLDLDQFAQADLALLLLLAALALGAVWLAELFRRRAQRPRKQPPRTPQPQKPQPQKPQTGQLPPRKSILIDGSNVIHWAHHAGAAKAPSLTPLHQTLALLKAEGYAAGVIFDATAGHILFNRYLHHDEFQSLLPEARDVFVVPKGTKADDYLIDMARSTGMTVVTNDRFRDAPLAKRVRKRRGEVRGGQVRLLPARI